MNLSDKIKKILEEGSPTAVPGTGKSLVSAESEVSGAEKTSKVEKGYDKSTKPEKLAASPSAGSSDEKATSETAKIKAEYTSAAMGKLKAESFEALFSGEDLTEEFKVKAEAIFEAAVAQIAEEQIAAKMVKLQEEHQVQLDEAVEAVKGELVEQIDGYLDYVVEQWMEDNAVALESGIKVEMVSSFMENMRKVFEDHYIDVPESKIDVVEEQAAQISVLQDEIEMLREATEIAEGAAMVLKCEAIITEHSSGLTVIEAEKLSSLAENVEFDTEEEFATKIKALRESFFRKGSKAVEQTQEELSETKTTETYSDVSAVLAVLRSKDGLKLIRSSN